MMTVRKPLPWLLGRIDRLAAACFGLCGGLALAQFPQYLAQYLQRLGGHVDEANLAAGLYKLPELAARAARLAADLHAVMHAAPLLRLPAFLLHADWAVAGQALRHFSPGMTFASEEICYLAAGAVLGVALYGGCKLLARGAARLFGRGRGGAMPKNPSA